MKHFRKLVGPYCFWLFVLTVLPMFLIMIYAFIQKGNAITTFSFTLDNFSKFFDPIFVSVLIKSFVLGIITTILCLAIGYPVAYAISKCKEKTQTLLILLITFPPGPITSFILSTLICVLTILAWINILSSKGIVSNMFQFLGFGEISLLYTDFAVILGMVYDFLPFMILPIHTSLTKMDKSLVEASNDLGANPVTTFWKITFRLSLGGVLTGITMVFLPAISSFVIPKLLGGGQYSLIGNFIEQQFINVGDWHFGSAVSLILAILVIVFMGLINRVEKYAGYQEESKREKTKKL